MNRDFDQLFCRERRLTGSSCIDTLPYRAPLQILHGNEWLAFVLIEIVNGTDMRLVQSRGGTSFALKPFDRNRVSCQFFGQKLECDSAAELSGHYYWIVDEMEAAGHYPRLAHPLEAKKRMGKTGKKTDNVDANGLGILLRNGTLPEVC